MIVFTIFSSFYEIFLGYDREEWMVAIEHVAARLHADPDNTDVDMPPVCEENDLKNSSSPSSLSNKMLSSPMDAGNAELQMKFLITGTSNRPHHSGKKKVVRKSIHLTAGKHSID